MSPQISRNPAARAFFEALRVKCPELDREWLRASMNSIAIEELRLVRRDMEAEVIRNRHYHGPISGNPADQVITLRRVLANIDRRIQGEHV